VIKKTGKKDAPAALPPFVDPCLAKISASPPQSGDWVHEVKFDGYRLQARIDSDDVRLFTRSGLDWTAKFDALQRNLKTLNLASAIIDGEAIVEDERGVSSFSLLEMALKEKRSARIVFVAFDLLFLNGIDIRGLPLAERKELLRSIVFGANSKNHLRFSEHLEGDGRNVLSEACKLGLEGIISKRIDKPYRSGRRGDWLKSKCKFSDEFIIAGFTRSTGAKNRIGALVLAYKKGKSLRYAGRVGTGFTERSGHDLWVKLQELKREASPFADKLDRAQSQGVIWAEPVLVASIEWSSDGLLRHATYKALREDKPAKDVRKP
jgi:bifunctional non-homologous end joining protein LigD